MKENEPVDIRAAKEKCMPARITMMERGRMKKVIKQY